ncbi:MAG: peptidoglycan bridge formation glycyltransferase FemA/FemB family protein [Anaerolineales bacterium]|nr:peptidoglycan bridge formation glycyltransferase FemA/FemB family protein [Anaerolineales bacterium]
MDTAPDDHAAPDADTCPDADTAPLEHAGGHPNAYLDADVHPAANANAASAHRNANGGGVLLMGDAAWNRFVEMHPDGHLLQLADWGRLKADFGWQFEIAHVGDAGALILYRPLPLRMGMLAYLPAAPLFSPDEAVNAALWREIAQKARRRRAAFVKAEPCNWYRPRPDLPGRLERAGFLPSPQTVQPPRTVVIDLSGSEQDILKRMNQSTRRKCNMAEKQDVAVRVGTAADVASFTALIDITGVRNKFGVHEPAYYKRAYDLFAPSGHAALLIAAHAGQDLAGVMVFRCGENAYYLYGASSNAERQRMATYILQWEAIRWARAGGARRYDLWGVPDADEATLEAEFEGRSDGLWGVYGFKRGFGGRIVRSVGAWDKALNPVIYAAYRWYLRRRA